MSNKNDPYNYANVHHSQLMARTLVDQDSDMESVAGSVQKATANVEDTDKKDKPEVTDTI